MHFARVSPAKVNGERKTQPACAYDVFRCGQTIETDCAFLVGTISVVEIITFCCLLAHCLDSFYDLAIALYRNNCPINLRKWCFLTWSFPFGFYFYRLWCTGFTSLASADRYTTDSYLFARTPLDLYVLNLLWDGRKSDDLHREAIVPWVSILDIGVGAFCRTAVLQSIPSIKRDEMIWKSFGYLKRALDGAKSEQSHARVGYSE